jgi:L-serine dehydratase
MAINVLDLFKIGNGPSSSHTVGPMRAARLFALALQQAALLGTTARVTCELYGSLGATGKVLGSHTAVMLGLMGHAPDTVKVDAVPALIDQVHQRQVLTLLGAPNEALLSEYKKVPYPFTSRHELLAICKQQGLSISQIMWANERPWRSEDDIHAGLQTIWRVMRECVQRGLTRTGTLPGPYKVQRRAPLLAAQLRERAKRTLADPLSALDWVNVYAFAVNEENASGGRVVTAPTNGAAGVTPAVLHYCDRFVAPFHGRDQVGETQRGAEVGCQGEVGVACSMAAEIGMEHNLDLTGDPVGGLVQVPCSERNAMGAVKAINAARKAMQGNGHHVVSLDKVIKTMRETGADMKTKYKETSRGGLAVNIVEC